MDYNFNFLFFCGLSLTKGNISGGLLQLVFELSKSKLEVFKYQIKSAKDILPLNLPKASDRMNV